MRVRRIDFAGGEQLSSPVRMDNGFLLLDGYPSRAGVFRYLNPDGSERLEFRPPEEVARSDSLKSLECCPLTDEHPPQGFVSPENVAQFGRGLVLEGVTYDSETNRMRARVLATHASLIDKLARGDKSELSCGYEADVVPMAGTWEGQPYTHIQKNIIYNHLAVVTRGRAGPECALRLDSEGHVSPPLDTAPPEHSNAGGTTTPNPAPGTTRPVKRQDMAKVCIEGVEFEVDDKLAAAIAQERSTLDQKSAQERATREAEYSALEAKLAAMVAQSANSTTQVTQAQQQTEDAKRAMAAAETENAALKQQVADAKTKLDAAEAKVALLESQRTDAADESKIEARLLLQQNAVAILGSNYSFTGKKDHAIRCDVMERIGKANPEVGARFERMRNDAAAVAVMFDAVVPIVRSGGLPTELHGESAPGTSSPLNADAARIQYERYAVNAWRAGTKPPSKS